MTEKPNRRRRALAVATVLGGVLAGGLAAPAGAAALPSAGGVYQLAVKKSGKCIDVPGASSANGALLQQWGCTEGAAWQQFALTADGSGKYRLVNKSSGKCIDVPAGSKVSGVQLQQWGCAGQTNQQWTLAASGTDTFQVVNVNSGLCMSLKDASTASGAAIIQETCTANSNKQWAFKPVGSTAPTTVASDGTGTYRTVQAAVNAVGTGNASRVTITIKPGTYREQVNIPADKPFVTLRGTGDSSDDVVIIGNRNAGDYGTAGSATVVALGHDFAAENLTMTNDFDENSSDTGDQALALYLDADRAVLDDVRLLGDQDTFLLNDRARAYVVDSRIEGTVDFIYGGGTAVFHGCTIHERRTTGGPITAASTAADKTYGFLFYRSTITGAVNNTTQLGRPWRANAQVLYRESSLSSALATAQPWTDMSTNSWKNARFSEYRNTGAGATVNGNRPQLTDAQAANYTPQKYLAGTDGWNPVR
ncbi:pectinesterase family protein [Streptomyces sp. NBC_00059]|uniref:pectinesterase family protein n=1 Tax=Streptomyces sp. NBC_00059 TaxID=2975635 RepID=UPI0022566F34|nr:pectinesterase family protein [Streptomyces sp. NBC_00059]MCX5410481.1 pectinesterase family protein [Streptomyces sp. NBC_00059]